MEAGVANGLSGQPLSGMGIAVGDFSGSGWEDLFVVNFSRQPRAYYRNNGNCTFTWGSLWSGIGDPSQPYLAFGVETLDDDLDGHLDLVVGNGHINDVLGQEGEVTYREPQQLLRNLGDGRFTDVKEPGDLARPRITRGLAVGDYDNDGRPDILASGPGSPLTLYHNEGAKGRHWIRFRLEGRQSNRDGIGARVTLRAGGRQQTRTVRSGSSYCSRSDIRPLFGLGAASTVDSLEIIWPTGRKQTAGPLSADRTYVIEESGE
jgi:hypothetical protein